MSSLTLTVHACRGLVNRNWITKMDPYVEVRLSEHKARFRTRTHKNGHQTPSFEQTYSFDLEGRESLLLLLLLGDDHLGRLDVSLAALDVSGKPCWYNLCDRENFKRQTGQILLTARCTGHANVNAIAVPSASILSPASAHSLSPENSQPQSQPHASEEAKDSVAPCSYTIAYAQSPPTVLTQSLPQHPYTYGSSPSLQQPQSYYASPYRQPLTQQPQSPIDVPRIVGFYADGSARYA
jgi:hypothetical protein